MSFGPLDPDIIPEVLKYLFPDIDFAKTDIDTLIKQGPCMISDFASAADFLDTEESLTSGAVIKHITDNAESRRVSRKIGFG